MSESFITYKNSFNSGDLITMMPGMQKIYRETGKKAIIYQRLDLPADYSHDDNHPIQTDGKLVCMNETMFNLLKPLIESQEYVEKFEIWQGQEVLFDFDKTRMNSQMPLPGGSIFFWPVLIFPQLEADLTEPWISPKTYIDGGNVYNKIVVNFTERYRNPYISYFFLKPYESDILFVGTQREHELFCNKNDLSVKRFEVSNFDQLAALIKVSKLFIGCQSMAWQICNAMGVKSILEVCTAYPNCFPTNKNGRAFIAQEALEHYFHQLLKEAK